MIGKDEVEKLYKLARIKSNTDELENITKDLGGILDYVSILKEKGEGDEYASTNRNVFREDGNPHKEGEYSDRLLKLSPREEGGYISVEKVIKKDK